MSEEISVRREFFRRARTGFPWGAVLVYLVFVAGNAFSVPAPSGGALLVVSEEMAEACGSPVTAALIQLLWSGLLGAALSTMEVPFLLERRTLLWSAVHFLATAAVFSLAGRRCRWFPYRGAWLCLLGLLLLAYVLKWSVRFLEWQADLRAIRKSAGLPEAEPPWKTLAPYLLLAAAVELLLPPALMLADARDFPVLTGIFYPFFILPLFCFFSACPLAARLRRWWPVYPAFCMVFTLPGVFLIYNSSALFFTGLAGAAALAGGALGAVLRKLKKVE
ncbi:DUF3021 family protein [uncultured Oscillibacter sp.]|uniref:DUF3021 family protein n=1 Tax=uncultured Oscillibacter sp. TaxID=876091 RepID=UPI0025F578F8|nr:DUF3021 family protein [uncultured Oscillibacter sp.]